MHSSAFRNTDPYQQRSFALAGLVFLIMDSGRSWFRRIGNTVLLAAGFIILILPIILLNLSTIGVASPSPSQRIGWSMMVGTNIASHGLYNEEDLKRVADEAERRDPGMGEHPAVFHDGVAGEIALKGIREHPIHFSFVVLFYKIPNL